MDNPCKICGMHEENPQPDVLNPGGFSVYVCETVPTNHFYMMPTGEING